MSTALTNPRNDGAYAVTVNVPTIVAGVPPVWGSGTVTGTVRVSAVPSARTVEIYDQATRTLIATVVSNGTTGAWTLSGLTTARPLRVIYRGNSGERDVTIQGVHAT